MQQLSSPTPLVGASHRSHPVASGHRHSRDTLPPPPPPKSSSNNHHRRRTGPKTPPMLSNHHKGPSTPPPPPPNSHYKKVPNNKQKYSPVSDQSGSPKSPRRRDNTAYEAISDTESKQMEDISPPMSTNGKKQEEDDDNMSLSPISPTAGNSKVELNIQNIGQIVPLPSNLNSIPSGFPLRPPPPQALGNNFVPSQNFYPQPPGNMPTPPPQPPIGPNSSFIPPPPHSSFNHQTLPPFQGSGPGISQHNTNQPLPIGNTMPQQQPQLPTIHHNTQQTNQEQRQLLMGQPPPHQPHHQQQRPPNFGQLEDYLRRNRDSFVNQPSMLPKELKRSGRNRGRDRGRHFDDLHHPGHSLSPLDSPVEEHPPLTDPPVAAPSLEDLPFVFQVKAGCARDISQELKRILSKDTLRRLVEQSAFQAFENWWVKQRSLLESKQQQQQVIASTEVKDKKTDKQPTTAGNAAADTDTNDKGVTTSSIDDIEKQTWSKNKQALTEIVQSMFGQDKSFNNHNSSFLSSFRISRRPSASSNSAHSKPSHHQHRKRHAARAWPSMREDGRTGKLQRIEESEEDESEEENEEGDKRKNKQDQNEDDDDDSSSSSDDQFEEFLKQRDFLFVILFHFYIFFAFVKIYA